MTGETLLIHIENLDVSYPGPGGRVKAVRNASLELSRGWISGLAGESGSGKSTIVFAILRYLGTGSIDGGRIMIDGTDMAAASPAALRNLRARRMALVPQDPLAALNPVMTIKEQLIEGPVYSHGVTRQQALRMAQDMLQKVKLDDPQRILESYPHQLSGGQQQRVLIASALLANPDVLLLDEPTTGLDATVQNGITDLIQTLVQEYRMACLFVSHDLDVLGRVCDTLAIMQNGTIVESGPSTDILNNPQMPYTQALLAARPRNSIRPANQSNPNKQIVLEVNGLSKTYHAAPGWFGQSSGQTNIMAVSAIDLSLSSGETLAIVGQSGSGKSTLAKLLLGLEIPDAGSIMLNGQDIARQRISRRPQNILHAVQMVFQNPASTLNPSHTVGYQLSRALR
ncbi:MAG: ABC transporter ATP-binding protein, partial [Beijerinckiaceae bacterium]|nr:ABC transporter ATP-binding protein [Beijerinckiaceae bacterium]